MLFHKTLHYVDPRPDSGTKGAGRSRLQQVQSALPPGSWAGALIFLVILSIMEQTLFNTSTDKGLSLIVLFQLVDIE